MKGSGFGPMIDEHEFVLRLNDAPVKGFEVQNSNRGETTLARPAAARAAARPQAVAASQPARTVGGAFRAPTVSS